MNPRYVIIIVATLILVGGGMYLQLTTPKTTPDSNTPASGLRQKDSETPAAGVCDIASEKFVTVTINEDIPSPRCVRVTSDQILRVKNNTRGTIFIGFTGLPASAERLGEISIEAGEIHETDIQFGKYLSTGVHRLTGNPFPGGEIWLIPLAPAPHYFEDFPAGGTFSETPAIPNFETNLHARTFRTAISTAAKKGPNFAGYYTIATWGCGTSCQSSAIIDARDGKIVAYGIPSAYGLAYALDSNLLVVNPRGNLPPEVFEREETFPGEHFPLGSVPTSSDYYVMENGSLRFLGKFDARTSESPICIQVVAPARNPFTQEVVQFGSPCTIPFGWEALETAEGEF